MPTVARDYARSEFVCKWATECARVGVELGRAARSGERGAGSREYVVGKSRCRSAHTTQDRSSWARKGP